MQIEGKLETIQTVDNGVKCRLRVNCRLYRL